MVTVPKSIRREEYRGSLAMARALNSQRHQTDKWRARAYVDCSVRCRRPPGGQRRSDSAVIRLRAAAGAQLNRISTE